MGRSTVRGKMVHLGHGTWVKSDTIVAIEPIIDGGRYIRNSRSRSRVLIAHPEKELIASRTTKTILRDMTEAAEIESHNSIQEVCAALKLHTNKLRRKGMDSMGSSSLVDPLVKKMKQRLRSEREIIIDCLVENDTVRSAIQASPFGQTKFYKLVKKYGIDTRQYRNVTNDSEAYHDSHNVSG